MRTNILPNSEVKARIQKQGVKRIQAFLNEVPVGALVGAADYLPAVDGFRKKSEAGIAKQKEVLARRLSRPGAVEQDYRALNLVWRIWISEILRVSSIQAMVDEIEDLEGDSKRDEKNDSEFDERVNAILKILAEESQNNRCSREQIELFFIYSLYPETSASSEIIRTAKGRAEVERDSALKDLPIRLRQDEGDIQLLKEQHKTIFNRSNSIAADLSTTQSELTKLRANVGELKSVGDGLRKLVIELGRLVDTQSIIKGDVETHKKEISNLSKRLLALDELQSSSSRFGADQKKILSEGERILTKVDSLAQGFETVKEEWTAFRGKDLGGDNLGHALDRLTQVEERMQSLLDATLISEKLPKLNVDVCGVDSVHSGGLPWTRLMKEGREAVPIKTGVELARAFGKACLSIGLRTSSAQIFAEECAAAAMARQVVFLKGALATPVARMFARVLGGAASARIVVPVGLLDGEALRTSINNALHGMEGVVGALAIEGINRTAFDVTREVLWDFSDPVLLDSSAVGRRVAIFASVGGGIASIPIESTYFELGPVFDLDYMEWRSNRTQPELSDTRLSNDTENAMYALVEKNTNAGAGEAGPLARAFTAKRNPQVERTVIRAYQALNITRSDRETITPLQSLYYGWLLPYWIALGLTKNQIDSELDGGKADGKRPDERLAAMVAAAFPNVGRKGDQS